MLAGVNGGVILQRLGPNFTVLVTRLCEQLLVRMAERREHLTNGETDR